MTLPDDTEFERPKEECDRAYEEWERNYDLALAQYTAEYERRLADLAAEKSTRQQARLPRWKRLFKALGRLASRIRMRMRILVLGGVLILVATPSRAFVLFCPGICPVTDFATLAQHALQAVLGEKQLETVTSIQVITRRMARGLSIFEDLRRYVPANVPRWRTWRLDNPSPDALAFMTALNAGVALVDAVAPVRPLPDPELTLPSAVLAGLAALDLADSVLVTGVDQTGRIRAARRPLREAIEQLEAHATDPSVSATGRLDTLSGAALLRARQQDTRVQLSMSLMDQVVVENLAARDVETAVMQMRFAALQQAPNLLAGTAADLRGWRQP